MDTAELISAFGALDPRIRAVIVDCREETQQRTPRQLDFHICSEVAELLAEEGAHFKQRTLSSFGSLLEKALVHGNEAVDIAVTTGMVELLCHWMNHEDPRVVPVARHLGARAFRKIVSYSQFMGGLNYESWPWVNFLKTHQVPTNIREWWV